MHQFGVMPGYFRCWEYDLSTNRSNEQGWGGRLPTPSIPCCFHLVCVTLLPHRGGLIHDKRKKWSMVVNLKSTAVVAGRSYSD